MAVKYIFSQYISFVKGFIYLIIALFFSNEVVGRCAEDIGGTMIVEVKCGCSDATLIMSPDSSRDRGFISKPKLAAKLALLPGGGQIYNRDYWKLSLVYASLGVSIYTYHLNSIKYNDYLSAYRSFYILDRNDANFGSVKPELASSDSKVPVRVRNLLNTSSRHELQTKDQIIRGKNYWRRNKGFALIATGLIYALQIIEANVSAHLKTFELSDDLTIRLEPTIIPSTPSRPSPGMRLVINFK